MGHFAYRESPALQTQRHRSNNQGGEFMKLIAFLAWFLEFCLEVRGSYYSRAWLRSFFLYAAIADLISFAVAMCGLISAELLQRWTRRRLIG